MHSLIYVTTKAIDIGYTGPWAYGHLAIAAVFVPVAILAWRLNWRTWLRFVFLAMATWSVASAAIVRYVFQLNEPLTLPTQAFLKSGSGKVLDIGCGSGRATLAVLMERPQTTVVALDNWSADYIKGNGPDRLLSNAEAIGAEKRVETKTGDMRSLPFPEATFDGVISTYAIDHVSHADSIKSLKEAARVLKPGGEFLLAVMNGDGWTLFTFGPYFHHNPRSGLANWKSNVEEAGLIVEEAGKKPWTVYILSRKPGK